MNCWFQYTEKDAVKPTLNQKQPLQPVKMSWWYQLGLGIMNFMAIETKLDLIEL